MVSIFYIIAGIIIGHLSAILYLGIDYPYWVCILIAMLIPILIYLGYNQVIKYGMKQAEGVAKILNFKNKSICHYCSHTGEAIPGQANCNKCGSSLF